LELTKNQLYQLSNITLFVMGGIGLFIVSFFQEIGIREMLFEGYAIYWQVLIGIAYGLVTAGLALALVSRKGMESVSGVFHHLFSKLDLQTEDIVFYSFCAGFGEEFLFRAGIQPLLGLWPTAIIFVAIHGYLNPRNWRIFIYGFLLVFVSAGFGYLFEIVGIFSAAIAHMVFDIVMFRYLIKKSRLNPEREKT